MGPTLRGARARRGITLDRASQATRIPRKWLKALEADAPPEHFPAPAYERMFLREYARYLGLSDEELVERLVVLQGADDPPPVLPRWETDLERPRRQRVVQRALLAASAALLLVLLLVSLARGGPSRDPIVPVAIPEADTSGTDVFSPAPPSPRRASAIALRVRVGAGPCWVRVVADGRTVVERTLQPGAVARWTAKRELVVRLGDAGVARLWVGGRPLGVAGERGRVAELRWVLRDGRIVRA